MLHQNKRLPIRDKESSYSGIMPAAQTQLTAAGLPGIFTRFPFNPNPTKA
ncbi:hypothetical protein PORCRE_150 [Porphyromonas crevioricanis JCM 15906]|uniref:Uncharacterized protein n=1 Tax=Porphyromonas crevioricanis JCM 15906 TaxID=1305617 RepID=S4N974_9PORP|nr:hypothetical protein PORCRE_150 [Porphyromonas crevioricanis JCM 15906]